MFNQAFSENLKKMNNKNLKCVNGFFHLGLWTKSYKEDKEARIGIAGAALKKMEVK